MLDSVYQQLSKIEDSHWWFQHRREIVADLLTQWIPSPIGRTALDIGSGTGGNFPLLKRFCENVVGLEKSPLAIELCRRKENSPKVVQGDASFVADYFKAESFDLITVFNVLYHQWIESEKTVASQIWKLLKPGGVLVVSEPAFPILWRRHDQQDLGRKRYRLAEISNLLKEAGLVPLTETYYNSFSFLPALALAGLEKLQRQTPVAEGPVGELSLPPSWLNGLAFSLGRFERRWIQTIGKMPIGVTLLCAARKPIMA